MAMAGHGVLAGIARHARPRAAMEPLQHAVVTCETGIAGDFRGAMRGASNRRQVTLIERADWDAALAEVEHELPWQERRANLLVDGIDLPQRAGARLHIGETVILEVTRECDPCERMEALAQGLRAALTPDWRGGACTKVICGGTIQLGDVVRLGDAQASGDKGS